KSERAESAAAVEAVRRLALAHPEITFVVATGDRTPLTYPAAATGNDLRERVRQVLGREFAENAVEVTAEREGVRLAGFAGLPTLNRANSRLQYMFVNGRPVQDRLLSGAVRGAYADVLARDRHPLLVLFIDVDPHEVDVNVHPAKAEVRFRDPGLVRGLVVGALKQALAGAGHRASSTIGQATMSAVRPTAATAAIFSPPSRHGGFNEAAAMYHAPLQPVSDQPLPGFAEPSAEGTPHAGIPDDDAASHPLGAARAQVHENYIIAQTDDGIVIVDQHAAHERLVYERLKRMHGAAGIPRQALLVPEVVELDDHEAETIAAHADRLAELGLAIESFGPGAVLVRETPAILGTTDVHGLVRDLAAELTDLDGAEGLADRLDGVL